MTEPLPTLSSSWEYQDGQISLKRYQKDEAVLLYDLDQDRRLDVVVTQGKVFAKNAHSKTLYQDYCSTQSPWLNCQQVQVNPKEVRKQNWEFFLAKRQAARAKRFLQRRSRQAEHAQKRGQDPREVFFHKNKDRLVVGSILMLDAAAGESPSLVAIQRGSALFIFRYIESEEPSWLKHHFDFYKEAEIFGQDPYEGFSLLYAQ